MMMFIFVPCLIVPGYIHSLNMMLLVEKPFKLQLIYKIV